MMSFIRSFLVLCLCCFATLLNAQRLRLDSQRSTVGVDIQPLVVVDSFTTDVYHLLLSPDRIESIDILNNSKATAAYGDLAKHGVLIIHPKKNTEILKLHDLLNRFSIPEADRKLSVCIDNFLVKDVNKLLADKNDIASVEVVKDNIWITPGISGPEERHINIVTKRSRKP